MNMPKRNSKMSLKWKAENSQQGREKNLTLRLERSLIRKNLLLLVL
jgi:hypothetical protein